LKTVRKLSPTKRFKRKLNLMRTLCLKIINTIALLGILGSQFILEFIFDRDLMPYERILHGIFFLAIGTFLIFACRELHTGIKRMRSGKFEEAISIAQKFADDLNLRPWRRLLFRLTLPIYTVNADAAALCIIGQAFTLKGDPTNGRKYLYKALELDPKSPVIYAALAQASFALGDKKNAEIGLQKARNLGFSSSLVDRAIKEIEDAQAKIFGK